MGIGLEICFLVRGRVYVKRIVIVDFFFFRWSWLGTCYSLVMVVRWFGVL